MKLNTIKQLYLIYYCGLYNTPKDFQVYVGVKTKCYDTKKTKFKKCTLKNIFGWLIIFGKIRVVK